MMKTAMITRLTVSNYRSLGEMKAAMMANFYTQGEICSNGTRVFVEAPLHNRFMDLLLARTETMRIGDPMDPQTQVGALISADHRAKVLGYVEAGVKAGAHLVCGGRAPADPALAGGYFVRASDLRRLS